MRVKGFLIVVVAVLGACAGPPTVQLVDTPMAARFGIDFELGAMRAEAASLLAREDYASLKEAFRLFRKIETKSGAGAPVDENHLRAALLLAARAGEIGVRDPAYLADAARLIESNAAWAGYAPYLALVRLLPVKTAGIFDDGPEPVDPRPAVQAMMKNESALFGGAEDDPVLAYLRGALHAAYPGNESISRILPGLLRRFPDSLALKYRLAGIVPNATGLWDEVLEADPEFYEVLAARGERALGEQRLLSAENLLAGV